MAAVFGAADRKTPIGSSPISASNGKLTEAALSPVLKTGGTLTGMEIDTTSFPPFPLVRWDAAEAHIFGVGGSIPPLTTILKSS